MTLKSKRQLQHWLEGILEPIDQAIERNGGEDCTYPSPQWYKVGCVVRALLDELETE